jgi:hypothetical protein
MRSKQRLTVGFYGKSFSQAVLKGRDVFLGVPKKEMSSTNLYVLYFFVSQDADYFVNLC